MNTAKRTKVHNPENSGVTPAVREKFLALGAGHPPVSGRVIVEELRRTYAPNLIAGALYYLTKHGELVQTQGAAGPEYVLGKSRELKRHYKSRAPAVAAQEYIGILLDDVDVVLTVAGQTLRMKPATFKALRQRLKSIDFYL